MLSNLLQNEPVTSVVPLTIFCASPRLIVPNGEGSMLRESLPEMEQFLNRSLLNFFEAYSSHGRSIKDLLGA